MKVLTSDQRKEYLTKMRLKMKSRGSKGYKRDPFEYRIPKAKDGEEINLYLRVLPELANGEKCEGGVSEKEYDFFFYENGGHWLNNKKYECPRVHDGDECPICQLAFELLNDTKDDAERKSIISKYLPRSYYAINAYFLDIAKNPDEVRGKTMWLSVGKTIYDMFEQCLNSEDAGDEDDPKAYGFFYDVTEGYTFKLVAKKKGEWNSYESSKFLPRTLGPLVDGDGSPDEDAITKILNQRHDIVTKFDDRDLDKCKQLVKELVNGGDDDDDWDEDETTSTKAPKKAKKKPVVDDDDDVTEKPKSKTKAKEKQKKEPEDTKEDEDLVSSDDDDELDDLISSIEDDE